MFRWTKKKNTSQGDSPSSKDQIRIEYILSGSTSATNSISTSGGVTMHTPIPKCFSLFTRKKKMMKTARRQAKVFLFSGSCERKSSRRENCCVKQSADTITQSTNSRKKISSWIVKNKNMRKCWRSGKTTKSRKWNAPKPRLLSNDKSWKKNKSLKEVSIWRKVI